MAIGVGIGFGQSVGDDDAIVKELLVEDIGVDESGAEAPDGGGVGTVHSIGQGSFDSIG